MSLKKGTDSCIVVGAGIAGLLAARMLHEHGIRVVVLDKARGIGGRMATRRIEQGVFDHGAQFFTVRDRLFERLVEGWLAEGVMQEWCRGFAAADGTWQNDGHSRYRGATGMTSIPKHLARDLDVRTRERVVKINIREQNWEVQTEGGNVVTADALILTPPVPQSLALIDAGNFVLSTPVRQILESISYDPCIAVMALLEGPSRVPEPGGLQLLEEPVAWVADNHRKGISPQAWAITIHAGPQFSRTHWEADDNEVAGLLLSAAEAWLGSKVNQVQVHRWRYSQPVQVQSDPCLFVPAPSPLVFAGDAFGGPRVEGAALSGLAAAGRLLPELTAQNKKEID